ncbi:hypothetical protein [Tautonia rosea]|uniref:hypothetical protein n=1 Tax=Tautonia rosea TaxID=2728037 RepID=UPI0014751950|nr:hypothetical protein [Tautonia rosea]
MLKLNSVLQASPVALATVFLTACSLEDTIPTYIESSLQHYCSPSQLSLEEWVDHVPVIVSGTVLEVAAKHHATNYYSNSCWALINVQTSYKGDVEQQIWVEGLYNTAGKPQNRLSSSERCYFEKNNSYIIMGYKVNDPHLGSDSHHLVTARNGDEGDPTNCPPVIKTTQGDDIVKKLTEMDISHDDN